MCCIIRRSLTAKMVGQGTWGAQGCVPNPPCSDVLVSHLVLEPELPEAEEHEPTLRCCSRLAAPLRACDARAARATRTRGAVVHGLLLLRMQFITLDNMAYVHEVRGESRGQRGM